MSNATYKQDLHDIAVATAQASKKYIDKKINQVYYDMGQKDISTIDHDDEATYQVTAPAGAKLLMLQKVGGNVVKYNPSTASDDTTALVKTMPATVYDFDANKIYGASEVSENLIPKSKIVATQTYQGITATNNNDGTITLNGTYIGAEGGGFKIIDKLNLPAGTYSISYFNDKVSTGANDIFRFNAVNLSTYNIGYLSSTTNLTATKTIEETITSIWLRISANSVFDNITIKPMLVKGSTAPTEFKVGFSGIHNLELSGLKVDGANKYLLTANDLEIGAIAANGTDSSLNTRIRISQNSKFFLKAGTYALSFANLEEFVWYGYTTKTNTTATYNQGASWQNSGTTFNLTNDCYVRFAFRYSGSRVITSVNELSNVMLNRGSTALPYEPYVSTTKTIDLSSIEDSGGNKLFADGKLRLGDYITPNKANKGANEITITSSSTYSWISSTNDACTISLPINSKASRGALCLAVGNDNISYVMGDQNNFLYFVFTNAYSSADELKNAMQNVIVVYPLATPIEADIDFSFLKNIQGYPNGSITAQNTYDMAVHSEIRYNSIVKETLATAVKVEGANILPTAYSEVTNGTTSGFTSAFNLSIKKGETISIKMFKDSGTISLYNFSFYDGTTWHNDVFAYNSNNDSYHQSSVTFSYDVTQCRIFCSFSNSPTFKVMLVRGSVAPTSYRPYKTTVTRALPYTATDGYSAGTARNYRVFSDNEGNAVLKRETNVSKVDLGSLNYTYNSIASTPYFNANISDIVLGVVGTTPNMITTKYTVVERKTNAGETIANDMSICNALGSDGIIISNSAYTDATAFKTAMSGVPLYYELADASKTETDMDDFDYFFDIDEGDTITFVNAYAQQVYATYSFLIKEDKSNE